MKRMRPVLGVLVGLAMVSLLVACKSQPSEKPYTSEFYSDGVKHLSWSGKVQGRVTISYWPSGIDNKRHWGAVAEEIMQNQHQPVPMRPGFCYLELLENPGSVSIIEQPDPHNNYTCRILIDHNLDEPDRYNFNVFWKSQEIPE